MRGYGRKIGVGVALVASLTGCSKQSSYRMEPRSAPVEPAPATIEEAQAQLDREEGRLRRLTGQPQTAAGTTPPSLSGGLAPAPPPLPPPAPPAPEPSPTTSSDRKADRESSHVDGSRERAAAESCRDACRALSSMRRAADTVCRLAGEGDERCQSARRRVHDGEGQTGTCQCGTGG
ncbi:MAG: hypothetical protein EOO75_19350 [Myxococcales bacterium]|nr:MAG: hypothetical protein EOO75_19350 [Myxococcales bacterium]